MKVPGQSLSDKIGGRKVRTPTDTVLPNGKVFRFAAEQTVPQKTDLPDSFRGKGEKVR
jgi:hypothetical protein